MSLPSVYETEAFPIPPGHIGQSSQNQRSGMMTAFTRHKLLVFFTLACGLALGYLQFTRTPVLYRSSTQVLLIQQQIPLTHMATGIGYENRLSTQMRIVTSPELVRLAVDPNMFPQVADNTEAHSGEEPVSDEVASAAPEYVDPELRNLATFREYSGTPEILNAIVDGLAVKEVNEDMFELTFTGPVAEDCPIVVQAVTDAYQRFLAEEYASTATELLDLLERARGDLRTELHERQKLYREFVAASAQTPLGDEAEVPPGDEAEGPHGIDGPLNRHLIQLGGEEPINLHSQRLATIVNQQLELEVKIRRIKDSIEAVKDFLANGNANSDDVEAFKLAMSQMPLGELANQDAAIEARRTQLEILIEDLEFEDHQLSFRLGDDHPDRQRNRAQLELYSQRLASLDDIDSAPPEEQLQLWLDALESQLVISEYQLQSLDLEFARQSDLATALEVKELEVAELQESIDGARQLYNSVLRQIDEIKLVDDIDRVQLKVTTKPKDGIQVQPVFSTIMTIAGGLGALMGLVIGFLLEKTDSSFRSPEEIRGELSIAVIGHIPTFPDRMRLRNPDTKLDRSLWSFHRPGGSIAEAFKGIRTSLQFNRHEEVHQVLMVTSPSPGEGKSTVAANLAVSLAHLGKRVLLLDADLRRATQPRLFGILEEPGLTNILVDDVEPFDVIQQTEVEGLSLLAGGRQVRNPSEVLSSPKMADLVKILREQFDYVLIDTPPVLVVTDPLTVAPLADAVIGVLKLSRRTRREATATIERLIDVGGEMLGVVVNGLESGMGYGTGYGHGGYQYTYGYGYGYGRYYSQNEENGAQSDEQRRRIITT